MTAEFTALPVGWANFYHNKETDKVYAEPCPGVVTYTKAEVTGTQSLVVGTKTFMGYASFGADGSWEIAAHRPHYVMTAFVGEGTDLDREAFDKQIMVQTTGNLWELQ